MRQELWIVVGIAVVAALALAGFLVFVAIAIFVVRRARGPAGPTREEMLAELGYAGIAAHTWSRPFQGTALVFTDNAWRWVVRLPRYNTLSIQIEERGSPSPAVGNTFASENAELDARFVLSSALAARTVALVRNRRVVAALLAMPSLSLRLSGDELVISDPSKGASGAASKGASGTGSGVARERAIHDSVAILVDAMFGAMYSEHDGTIMPEFR